MMRCPDTWSLAVHFEVIGWLVVSSQRARVMVTRALGLGPGQARDAVQLLEGPDILLLSVHPTPPLLSPSSP